MDRQDFVQRVEDAIAMFPAGASRSGLSMLLGLPIEDPELQAAVRELDSAGRLLRSGPDCYRLVEACRRRVIARLHSDPSAESLRRRYLGFYLKLVAIARAERLIHPEDWLLRLDQEAANLEQALALAVELSTGAARARLVADLAWYLEFKCLWRRGYKELVAALEDDLTAVELDLVAELSHLAAKFAYHLGQLDEAANRCDETLELLAAANDERHLAQTIRLQGQIALQQGDLLRAQSLLEQALRRHQAIGNSEAAAVTLAALAGVSAARDEHVEAERLHREAVTALRACGQEVGAAYSLSCLGTLALRQQRFDEAMALHEESLAIHRRYAHGRGVCLALSGLAATQHAAGQSAAALATHDEAVAIARELQDRQALMGCLIQLAMLRCELGDLDQGEGLLREAQALCELQGHAGHRAVCLRELGLAAARRGDATGALTLLHEALALSWSIGQTRDYPDLLDGLAWLLADHDRPLALRLAAAADRLRAELALPRSPAQELRLQATLGQDRPQPAVDWQRLIRTILSCSPA